MGAQIEAVVTTRSRDGIFGKLALGLADDAAKACLRRAGREAHELDLLINAGIYRTKTWANRRWRPSSNKTSVPTRAIQPARATGPSPSTSRTAAAAC